MPPKSADLVVYAHGSTEQLYRPCVDCGRRTGNFCENDCLARRWLPDQEWAKGQITPQCTDCELKFTYCHFCRGVHMVTPPTWGSKISSALG